MKRPGSAMLIRSGLTPAWQVAQLVAEAALCLKIGAATIGRPADAELIGGVAGILALSGLVAIGLAIVATLAHLRCTSAQVGSKPTATDGD